MATTVGSHSVASFTAPINGTSPIDANSVRGNDNTLRIAYVAHDADSGIHVQSSTLATRPAPSEAGRKWITVDGSVVRYWVDTGTAWVEGTAAGLSTAQTIALTGDVTGAVSTTLASGASIATTLADNTVTSAKIVNGAIVNDDINASAGIVDTKLATIATAGKVSNSATTATATNTNSTIVARDGSGNFAAGTVTADLTGNASTATALSSNRTFALTGDVTGSVSSNLSSGASISTAIAAGAIVNADVSASAAIDYSKLASLTSGNILVGSASNVPTATAVTGDVLINNTGVTSIASGVIVDADINASAAIADTKLATIATAGKVSNSATTATSSNTNNAIVARDGSGNFSAGTITANLTGNVTGNVTGSSGSTTGNAATATALSSNRTFALTGDVTGSVSSDLSSGASISTAIAAGAIVNADISASAAIDYSKLASLASGNILVGSSGNVATSTAMTGDVTISNTGVTSIASGVIVNADINASAAIADTKLATIATAGKVSNSATTATSSNTNNAIVARDGSGNFSAGTITATLTGNASTATTSENLKSNATTGVLQVTGPGAGTTRVMTTPNANFTVARTDAGQTFAGIQSFDTIAGSSISSPLYIKSAGFIVGDRIVIGDSGVTPLLKWASSSLTVDMSVFGSGNFNITAGGSGSGANLQIEGLQVLAERQAAVTAPTGGATVDTQARTAINDIIARLQAHGLIS